MLAFSTMSCCACRQVDNLYCYKKDAKKAMLAFCENEFHRNYGYVSGIYGLDKTTWTPLYTFYIFNGIVKYRPGCREDTLKNRRALGYVEAFRNFIRRNKLGEVIETKTGFNRVNNPTHNILVCVWKPKPVVLRKWYMKNQKKVA